MASIFRVFSRIGVLLEEKAAAKAFKEVEGGKAAETARRTEEAAFRARSETYAEGFVRKQEAAGNINFRAPTVAESNALRAQKISEVAEARIRKGDKSFLNQTALFARAVDFKNEIKSAKEAWSKGDLAGTTRYLVNAGVSAVAQVATTGLTLGLAWLGTPTVFGYRIPGIRDGINAYRNSAQQDRMNATTGQLEGMLTGSPAVSGAPVAPAATGVLAGFSNDVDKNVVGQLRSRFSDLDINRGADANYPVQKNQEIVTVSREAVINVKSKATASSPYSSLEIRPGVNISEVNAANYLENKNHPIRVGSHMRMTLRGPIDPNDKTVKMDNDLKEVIYERINQLTGKQVSQQFKKNLDEMTKHPGMSADVPRDASFNGSISYQYREGAVLDGKKQGILTVDVDMPETAILQKGVLRTPATPVAGKAVTDTGARPPISLNGPARN